MPALIMIRIFDTSALIYDPRLITESYPGDDIIIPMTVLREIDSIKSQAQHPGSSAREVIRQIDIIRDTAMEQGGEYTPIGKGIERDIGGVLRVELNHITDTNMIPDHAIVETNDDKIILVTRSLASESEEEVVLVTQDRSMSIIAESWGVKTERHEVVKVDDKLPTGVVNYTPESDEIEKLYKDKEIYLDEDIPVNTGVIIKSGSSSVLGLSRGRHAIRKLDDTITMAGLTPRGVEQKVAADLLLGGHNGDNNREFLGSLSGRAGAGKTILAVAAGLHRIMENNEYDGIVIFRPIEPVGPELGALPGTVEEKMKPWTAAITDVLEALGRDSGTIANSSNKKVEITEDLISIEPSNYVRGRTFRNKWVIIEEAQNYEPVVLRTLLSRLGEDSAGIMTWDPSQVDNAYLRRNKADAPMSVLQGLLGSNMVWHVELKNPERGGVSALID